MSINWLVPAWQAPPVVQAAFTWRTGGASMAPYASLNLATHVGDASAAVRDNRTNLRSGLRLRTEPRWLQQVHGATVLNADETTASDAVAPTADAAFTRHAWQVLAIMVADCLPVLFASNDGSVVAAAHAGWRGLAAGVLENTVMTMAVAPASIRAWFGPAIRQPHFEVGDEVRAAFLAAAADSAERAATASAFSANARGRWQCDLAAIATLRLRRVGVSSIVDCDICTHADSQRCFSHRRDGQTGRMAALIWLAP